MDQDEFDPSNPWLVIPYFDGDEGRSWQRPLSKVLPPVISWLCPSIQVRGVNYSTPAGSYLPDQPLQINIKVDNRGVPNALVKLQVYWSNPATGFVNPKLIFTATQPVAGRSVDGPTAFLPPLIWTPEQASIPAHFCLLVRASCTPPEPSPGPLIPAPASDRHWAQYNLQSALVNTAGNNKFVFWAGNPALEAATYAVSARPLSDAALRQLARVVRAEPVAIKPQQLALQHATVRDGAAGCGASLVLELERGGSRALVLGAQELKLGPQQFTAVEVVQTRIGHVSEDQDTGSLGVVLFGDAEEGRRCR
jgi:hypothetical protein